MEHIVNISANKHQVIIRAKQVQAMTGLSKSSIYQMMQDGSFPQKIRIGIHSVGWLQSEIDQWITSRIEQSRNVTGR